MSCHLVTSPHMKFAIDRGGTFTDIYAEYGEDIYVEKLLSVDPANYDDAPREGIRRILSRVFGDADSHKKVATEHIEWIRMGTTVATNALLERKGAKTALLITRGFKDLLQIGYQDRPELFDLNIRKPLPLYERVLEVDERVEPENGTFSVLRPLQEAALKTQLKELKAEGIESIAVVLMHAYGFAEHEIRIEALAKEAGFDQISLSHRVIAAPKIVERGSTTVIDAYLTPHIRRYIKGFKEGFDEAIEERELLFMQSFGALCGVDDFIGANAILSGPAGGVVALQSMYEGEALIGFDMGGTSTDVSRYDGTLELTSRSKINGTAVTVPMVDLLTVAAGGGSRLFYKNKMFSVGPESSGAHPGPVCYKKGGYLSITDANLVLGRIQRDFFPHIFGEHEDEPLGLEESRSAFAELALQVNKGRTEPMNIEEIAWAFICVANDTMSKPIKAISTQRGFAVSEHVLVPFGGAGAQHACAMALQLGISEVKIHADAGILSAFGISQADEATYRQKPVQKPLNTLDDGAFSALFAALESPEDACRFVALHYAGGEQEFVLPYGAALRQQFEAQHREAFGFLSDEAIMVASVRIRVQKVREKLSRHCRGVSVKEPLPIDEKPVYFEQGWQHCPIYRSLDLYEGDTVAGPAIIIDRTSTMVIEPYARARVNAFGDITLRLAASVHEAPTVEADARWMGIFGNLFASIAEQMGYTLSRTARSVNIKERLDFSCALFNHRGDLVANAPHVPVHLGSMSYTVKAMLERFKGDIAEGDVFISNAPYEGGSHLPDITVMTPFVEEGCVRYVVASRGHHADIGGATPGSMPPFSTALKEEGALFTLQKCVENGVFQSEQIMAVLQRHGARESDQNIADIKAQIAANRKGITLLDDAAERYSHAVLKAYMAHIQQVSREALTRRLRELAEARGARLHAEDFLDCGARIVVDIEIDKTGRAQFDFSHSDDQLESNQNAPLSVTYSALIYALRTLVDEELPLNGGFLSPVEVKLRKGSLLNPDEHAAVVGGNVTTSQRIVDVIFKAFGIVAASCGCMNNLTFGNERFGYYETIGGGAGAGETFDGASGVHTHMTNTRITDPEILEQRYPVRLEQFALRKGSGGEGRHCGGNGLVREITFKAPMTLSLLSERRIYAPWGAQGGEDGKKGENLLCRDGLCKILKNREHLKVKSGDSVMVKTPGGGGFGSKDRKKRT